MIPDPVEVGVDKDELLKFATNTKESDYTVSMHTLFSHGEDSIPVAITMVSVNKNAPDMAAVSAIVSRDAASIMPVYIVRAAKAYMLNLHRLGVSQVFTSVVSGFDVGRRFAESLGFKDTGEEVEHCGRTHFIFMVEMQ
jgi:hypothetical protein